MNYKMMLQYLESLKGLGIVPGLESVKELLFRLNNPQDAVKCIHIAGTNGKGSVCTYVAAVLKAAGYQVGRYLSPVLENYCEKIQVDGRPISQAKVTELMETIKSQCDLMVLDGDRHPTVFEMETVAAFLYFREQKCDFVILEAGMGGREDATNVVSNVEVAGITSISMDHMQFLGKNLQSIAMHKAGIIKPGCIVVTGKQPEEVLEIIRNEAAAKGCRLLEAKTPTQVKFGLEKQGFTYSDFCDSMVKQVQITLAGVYQIENAALAIEIINALIQKGVSVNEAQLRKGMLGAKWPGRFEILSKNPYFIVDGAHNEDGAKRLTESLKTYFPNKEFVFIMGVLRDKEYEKMAAVTAPLAKQVITVTPDNARALPAQNLANCVYEYQPSVTVAGSLEEALEMAYLLSSRKDVIVCFGSLTFLGRMKKLVKGHGKKGGP